MALHRTQSLVTVTSGRIFIPYVSSMQMAVIFFFRISAGSKEPRPKGENMLLLLNREEQSETSGEQGRCGLYWATKKLKRTFTKSLETKELYGF